LVHFVKQIMRKTLHHTFPYPWFHCLHSFSVSPEICFSCTFVVVVLTYWGFNSEPGTYYAGALPLESWPQPFLLFLVIFSGRVSCFCLRPTSLRDPPTYASQ
jgi:hypothetical protein